MALLRVFVSSTCYDLGIIRSELRPFIEAHGHFPVMSEYSDVLFDPSLHTHDSCVREVTSCDIMIVIIGSRFGGKAVPSAANEIDHKRLNKGNLKPLSEDQIKELSITQIEVLKAIENRIPIYVFVENKVHHDHHLYEANKGNEDVISKLIFPSVQKQETAKYIFEFINFIRSLPVNNAIYEFKGLDDIKNNLRSQWSHKFQELLKNSSTNFVRKRQMDEVSEKIEDLKNVILVSLNNSGLKEVGRGVLKYRRMIEFLAYFSSEDLTKAFTKDQSFQSLCEDLGIDKFMNRTLAEKGIIDAIPGRHTYVIMTDGTFFMSRLPHDVIHRFESDWETFRKLTEDTKVAILHSVLDESDKRRPSYTRKGPGLFSDYIEERMMKLALDRTDEDEENDTD